MLRGSANKILCCLALRLCILHPRQLILEGFNSLGDGLGERVELRKAKFNVIFQVGVDGVIWGGLQGIEDGFQDKAPEPDLAKGGRTSWKTILVSI